MSDYVRPSKTFLNKCGDIIRSVINTSQEYSDAIQTVSGWRLIHAKPLDEVRVLIKKRLNRHGYKKIVVVGQRLKRMPSIIDKLNRIKGTELSRMQDIAGLRIIVPAIQDVKIIHDILERKTSTLTLSNEKDYINKDGPKPDGYRSVHMVFKYKSKKYPQLENYNVEVQIRTQLQHLWGTTVETLGMIDKESYKTGEGEYKTKRFLFLVSALFALKEGTKLPDELKGTAPIDIVKEITSIDNELKITTKLQGVAVTISKNKVNENDEYYVLELTVEPTGKGHIKIMSFKFGFDGLAENYYEFREQATKNQQNVSVLMIRAEKFNMIKKAYPNYFFDTQNFLKELNGICKSYIN